MPYFSFNELFARCALRGIANIMIIFIINEIENDAGGLHKRLINHEISNSSDSTLLYQPGLSDEDCRTIAPALSEVSIEDDTVIDD